MKQMLIAAGCLCLVPQVAFPQDADYVHFGFEDGRESRVAIGFEEQAEISGSPGTGTRLTLARSGPPLPMLGSTFSPLYRARDVMDVAAYPANAIAKMFRLDPDGRRSGNACTASFVGDRYLITAAHCIVNLNTGIRFAGFEVVPMFDRGGSPMEAVQVTDAWLPYAMLADIRAGVGGAIENGCNDIAIVRVSAPAGDETRWLSIRAFADGGPEAVYHRFSYPHMGATAGLKAALANLDEQDMPEANRAAIAAAIGKRIEEEQALEPDFSPENLYYQFGGVETVGTDYIGQSIAYALPGQSGSVLLDENHAAVAVLSRTYDGVSYSCRLSLRDIGVFQAIMADD